MARAALALPFSGLSGTLGDTVIVQLPDGPQVRRRRPVRGTPLTPAQAGSTDRLTLVSRAWKDLDVRAFEAWSAYARRQRRRNPATGAWATPSAYSQFVGHACKARQLDPERDLTLFMPPTVPFTGDGVGIEILPPGGGQGGGALGFREGADPSPAPPQGEGVSSLFFSADRANAPGVVTELLGQPLVNARRAVYRDKYVSLGFVAFEGPETAEVPLAAGAWACAYRFVRPASGQETALFELGVVEVAA